MSRDDIQKLLGGYATGTLTPEEQQALFEAALADQQLFDALAREEALRDVLSDPSARAQLLAAIDEGPAPWYRQWWRPMVVMAAALLIVVGVAVWDHSRAPKPLQLAKVQLPPPKPVVAENLPVLPPPPDVKAPAREERQLALPVAPAAAPPPPVLAVASPKPAERDFDLAKQREALTSDGARRSDAPVQQAQQLQPTQIFQQAQPFQQSPSQQLPQSQGRLREPMAAPAPPALAGNRLLDRTTVPLHGTVTDASGAAVYFANVTVKSLATGEVVYTSTDAKGEFTATGTPGSVYEISASATGFQKATVNEVAPANGTPEPVNLRLNVGTAAESVEVMAAAPALMATRAASGSVGGVSGVTALKKEKAPSVPAAALQYHLFSRIPGGEPVEVLPNGTAPAGATLILRVTPGADGYLRIVAGAGRAIASHKVRRGVAFETVLAPFDRPGRVELQVYFSHQAGASKDTVLAPAATIAFHIQ